MANTKTCPMRLIKCQKSSIRMRTSFPIQPPLRAGETLFYLKYFMTSWANFVCMNSITLSPGCKMVWPFGMLASSLRT